jgi:hypothetical protein
MICKFKNVNINTALVLFRCCGKFKPPLCEKYKVSRNAGIVPFQLAEGKLTGFSLLSNSYHSMVGIA